MDKFLWCSIILTASLGSKDILSGFGTVNSDTSLFLDGLGTKLQSANEARAFDIVTSAMPVSVDRATNDRAFVRFEQGIVSQELASLASKNPEAYKKITDNINSNLNGKIARVSALTGPDRNFISAAAAVRSRLGRDLDFKSESDRVAIGDELTAREEKQNKENGKVREHCLKPGITCYD